MSIQLVPVAQLNRELGLLRRNTLNDLVARGKFRSARRIVKPGQTRITVMVDPTEVRAYLDAHPNLYQMVGFTGPRVEPAPSGQLTAIQQDVLALERARHGLVSLAADQAARGAVRACFDDGESFVILPNGETTAYRYKYEW